MVDNSELKIFGVDMATGASIQISSVGFETFNFIPKEDAEVNDTLLDALGPPPVIHFAGTMRLSTLDKQRLSLAFKLGKVRELRKFHPFPKKYRRRINNLKRKIKMLDRKRKEVI